MILSFRGLLPGAICRIEGKGNKRFRFSSYEPESGVVIVYSAKNGGMYSIPQDKIRAAAGKTLDQLTLTEYLTTENPGGR